MKQDCTGILERSVFSFGKIIISLARCEAVTGCQAVRMSQAVSMSQVVSMSQALRMSQAVTVALKKSQVSLDVNLRRCVSGFRRF